MVILWYLKNNFIFLVKKIFIFVNDFKKTKRISSIPDSNRFTREFSVRRSAVIRIDESDRGRSLQVTMNLVHFKFLGAGLHGTLNHGVSVALSELD